MGIFEFWNTPSNLPEDMIGSYPMGGGGLVEAIYRNYFEIKHFKKIIAINKNSSMLELGSGNGRWAIALANSVANYTAVDFSAPMIKLARQRTQRSGISNIQFIEKQITDFIPGIKYDIVYLSGVSQYLSDQQLADVLNNISSWLSENAIIVDRSTVNNKCREIIKYDDYISILRTPEELVSLFSELGYAVSYRRRSYRFLRLGRYFKRLPLAWPMLHSHHVLLPAICHLLRSVSHIADAIAPVSFEGGERTHDFFVFKRIPITK